MVYLIIPLLFSVSEEHLAMRESFYFKMNLRHFFIYLKAILNSSIFLTQKEYALNPPIKMTFL